MLRVAALLCLAVPVVAHEFSEVKVSHITMDEFNVTVYLQDTTKGQMVVCAVYNADKAVIASRRTKTTNLATKILIPYRDGVPVSVQCIKDN